MIEYGKDNLAVGDRVTVIDLRTGQTHNGIVEAVNVAQAAVNVRYDTGGAFRVGVSFVRKADPA